MNTQHVTDEPGRGPGEEGRVRLLGGIRATERRLSAIQAADAAERRVGVDLTPELCEFERERLALFARHGFEGEGRWITDGEGRRTYMISRGEGSSPTVLVHGGLSQAGEWYLLANKFPGHVVIPDRPGCGLSYRIDYRGVDFRKAAAGWLLDVVDGVDADRVDLVANSIGGFFAIAFAVAHPERVRRLVLVGAPVGLKMRSPIFMRLWANPIIGPLITKLKITDPETRRKRVFPLLVAHPETVPLDFIELDIAAEAIPGVDRDAYTMLRAISTLRGLRPELMLDDDMARLSVPTLFAWGDADAFSPVSTGLDMAAAMPDARVEVIANAGHLVHVERPDTVASAINAFLAHSDIT